MLVTVIGWSTVDVSVTVAVVWAAVAVGITVVVAPGSVKVCVTVVVDIAVGPPIEVTVEVAV